MRKQQTCFVFIQDDIPNALYWTLRLDEHGELNAPFQARSLDALRALQSNAQTIVVLPASRASLHFLTLPPLADKKARAAIPYALEEWIAQPIAAIHVAFERGSNPKDASDGYRVVVMDKAYLLTVIAHLNASMIRFDAITLDWFALKADEGCVTNTGLLIRNPTFEGALSFSLVKKHFEQPSHDTPILKFNDSPHFLDPIASTTCSGSFYDWVALRLFTSSWVNIAQGEFRPTYHRSSNLRWYQISAGLFGFWFLSAVGLNGWMLHALKQEITQLDEKISVIYHAFFPDSKQVLSPQFRIMQWLKTTTAQQDRPIWSLMQAFSSAMKRIALPLTVEQLNYQHQTLSVTLNGHDVAGLEALQQALRQAHLQVKQVQAISHEHRVHAVLELRWQD